MEEQAAQEGYRRSLRRWRNKVRVPAKEGAVDSVGSVGGGRRAPGSVELAIQSRPVFGEAGVPDIVGDFERQEAARQAITELAAQAGLSEREQRVLEPDILTDYDTKAIARELVRSPRTVRVLRKRYRDKISKAKKT